MRWHAIERAGVAVGEHSADLVGLIRLPSSPSGRHVSSPSVEPARLSLRPPACQTRPHPFDRTVPDLMAARVSPEPYCDFRSRAPTLSGRGRGANLAICRLDQARKSPKRCTRKRSSKLAAQGFPKGPLYARPLHLFRRLAHVQQFPFDCLVPLSHFSPPGGHVKVGRPDVWVGYSRCGALAFVRLPLIGVSPIQAHDLAPQSGSQGKH